MCTSSAFWRAVRLRHRRAAEEGVFLDVRHRGLHHGDDLRVAGQRQLGFAVGGLQRERVAVDLLDRAAHAHGLRLLRRSDRARRREQRASKSIFIVVVMIILPERKRAVGNRRRAE